MGGKTRAALAVSVSATAILVASCSSGGNTPATQETKQPVGKAGGTISYAGCTPENPLIPAGTNETCGGDVLDLLTAKLVHYNADTAAPEDDIAESIKTDDNQNFTVKLKAGYKFSDGSEVKAKNFVDAWNWNRNGVNGMVNAYFFDVIDGAAALDCGTYAADSADGKHKKGDPDCEAQPPKARAMTGLKVVDDRTFTIKTTEKVANLPVRLGYTAYAPLPDSFFTDPKAYGEKPVGAGPYVLAKWDKTSGFTLTKNPTYSGAIKAQADTINVKFYTSQDAAYTDIQAGNLDVMQQIPSSAQAGGKYKTDLPGHTAEKETGVFQSISFPSEKSGDTSFKNVKLRQALSMAIDRKAIIDNIFNGARTPATGWVSPAVDGYKAGACGEYCTYDKAKAKALFDEAGGYSGTITLSYNVNGDHKGWTEAACGSITDALGVPCKAVGVTEFSEFRRMVNGRTMKGLFRTGWQMDYPSIENFLAPLYATGASSNDSDYSNTDFDKKLAEAAAATDPAKSNQLYQEAEAMLKDGMPVIPTWYGKAIAAWSTKVTGVKITPFGTIDLASVQTVS